ncbi:MAG: hypothetical protein ACFFFO_02370 [Candidatus Thorarchaeota archaeon]
MTLDNGELRMKVCQTCGVVLDSEESEDIDYCVSCADSSDSQSVRNSILNFWNSRVSEEKTSTES